MPTRQVVLTEHHAKIIDRLVKSGRYRNASEVLREGLRMIERREALEDAKLEVLREAARIGFADIDRGRFVDVSDDQLEGYIGELGCKARERIGKERT